MNGNVSYHLVLESRPGDFMPIDINLLQNSYQNYNYSSIENIDNFTKNYTKQELFKMITDSNIVPNSYLKGNLKVINDNRYRYQLLSKDHLFALDTFLKNNINNKERMNHFLNIYFKYSFGNKEEMITAIKNKNINKAIFLLLNLPYLYIRSIYVYLLNHFSI